jgi:hypothetical protein
LADAVDQRHQAGHGGQQQQAEQGPGDLVHPPTLSPPPWLVDSDAREAMAASRYLNAS